MNKSTIVGGAIGPPARRIAGCCGATCSASFCRSSSMRLGRAGSVFPNIELGLQAAVLASGLRSALQLVSKSDGGARWIKQLSRFRAYPFGGAKSRGVGRRSRSPIEQNSQLKLAGICQ